MQFKKITALFFIVNFNVVFLLYCILGSNLVIAISAKIKKNPLLLI